VSNDSELSFFNNKALSQEGCEELSASFVERLNKNSFLQNPWVTWEANSKRLGNEIFKNRNKPLSGIILGVKDVISTQAFETRMGTHTAWGNSTMGFNARIVAIATELGAVIGGKTKTSEFAVHQKTDVINPTYRDRSAGTSSAGSAAAVANGSVELALATQTAGSIARPSSYCGVVGFKPTFGDFPRTGVLKTTDEFDTIGVLGKNPTLIRDFYLNTRLSGPDHPVLETRRKKKVFKKVTMLIGEGFDSSSEDVLELMEKYFDSNIQKLGYDLIPRNEFADFNQIRNSHEIIYRRDLAYYFKKEIADESISASLLDFINLKNFPTISEYNQAQKKLSLWRKNYQTKFNETLILSLAASTSAPVEETAYEYDLNAAITAAGFPQLCIPAFNDLEHRSISVSLSGPKGTDEQVLELGIRLFTPIMGRDLADS